MKTARSETLAFSVAAASAAKQARRTEGGAAVSASPRRGASGAIGVGATWGVLLLLVVSMRPASVGAAMVPFTAHPSEIALAKKLLQFSEVLETVGRELRPNLLTDYLYELSRTFSRFYGRKLGVRVIDASPEEVRLSRLRLCDLTARTLKLGLDLLGIETVEQM